MFHNSFHVSYLFSREYFEAKFFSGPGSTRLIRVGSRDAQDAPRGRFVLPFPVSSERQEFGKTRFNLG